MKKKLHFTAEDIILDGRFEYYPEIESPAEVRTKPLLISFDIELEKGINKEKIHPDYNVHNRASIYFFGKESTVWNDFEDKAGIVFREGDHDKDPKIDWITGKLITICYIEYDFTHLPILYDKNHDEFYRPKKSDINKSSKDNNKSDIYFIEYNEILELMDRLEKERSQSILLRLLDKYGNAMEKETISIIDPIEIRLIIDCIITVKVIKLLSRFIGNEIVAQNETVEQEDEKPVRYNSGTTTHQIEGYVMFKIIEDAILLQYGKTKEMPEVSRDYFQKLIPRIEKLRKEAKNKNTSALYEFNKNLAKTLNGFIQEEYEKIKAANPTKNKSGKPKDKYLLIFSLLKIFNLIPTEKSELWKDENDRAKTEYIRQMLR